MRLLLFILLLLGGAAAPWTVFADDAVVRFTITNHGEDVGDRGKYLIYPLGERKKDLGYGYSGTQAKVPEGTYDILLRYHDGGVKKEVWREKKPLAGTVEETVEMDVKLAQVKYTLTNNGVAIGNKGRFLIFPAGEKKDEMADEPSGSAATVAAGVYDVLLKFKDGSVKKELWLQNQRFEGSVEKTIDVAVNLAEVVIHVTRLGQPSKIAWCGVYAPGERDEPMAKGAGEETLPVAEGTYDIGCFYNDAGISTEQWLKNQAVKGRTEFKLAFDFQRTTLKITPPPDVTSTAGSSVAVYVPGDRKRPVAKGALGDRLLLASGVYDVVMKVDKTQTTWSRVALEGEVVVPFSPQPPSKSLKNITILSPEPGPSPVLPAAAPPPPIPQVPPVAALPPPATPEAPEIPTGPEVVITSEGPPPQTLPPWAVVKGEKKRFGGCSLVRALFVMNFP